MSKSPSLRRIQADVRELAVDPSDRYHAAPLEDDMFEWHFTIRGADGTDFEGGVYHGRILLPTDYPFKPPNIVFLTPSGRFQTGVKVCLSFSAHHPELWQPAWGVRLILEALISFLPTPADGAIGALDWTPEERKRLAKKSREYCCPRCGPALDLLPELGSVKKSCDGAAKRLFQEEIAKLHMYQRMNEAGNKKKGDEDGDVAKGDGDGDEKSDDPDGAVEAKASSKTAAATPTKEDNPASDGVEGNESSAERASEKSTDAASAKQDNAELREKAVEEDGSPIKSDVGGSTPDQDHATELTTASAGGEEVAERADPVATVPSSISDPVVHAIFVTFLAIVVLLYRKVQMLLAELNELEG